MTAFKTAIACVGAMMGAGFASGKEICAFFSSYGRGSWVLIVIAVLMMMGLCFAILRASAKTRATQWMALYDHSAPWRRFALRLCVGLLFFVVGAGMVSAGGHLCSLVWGHPYASIIGSMATLLLGWLLTRGAFLTWLSGALTVLFVLLHVLLMASPPPITQTIFPQPSPIHLGACLDSIGYAAMNITLSIGIISKPSPANKWQITVYFGVLMGILLVISNALYLSSPVISSAFPMVQLLTVRFGRSGFLISLLLMYLAVLTTLVAIVCGLLGLIPAKQNKGCIAWLFAGLLLLSRVGFEGIVTTLYAPIGLLCLLFVFLPFQKY